MNRRTPFGCEVGVIKTAGPIEFLQEPAGSELGVSGWLEITQDRIDRFAAATGNHHTPVNVVPGFLTLSLVVSLVAQVALPTDPPPRHRLNYGLNRIRFPAPVHAGERVRARVVLVAAEEVGAAAIQVRSLVTIEIEGRGEPAMVAETVSRLIF